MKKSYQDLVVWNKAINLAKITYEITENFPNKESFGVTTHIRRSAVSIASNIAEWSARHGDREFIHFLMIARGSLAELHTQLIIANAVNYLTKEKLEKATEQINEIGKMIQGLKQSLLKSAKPLETID